MMIHFLGQCDLRFSGKPSTDLSLCGCRLWRLHLSTVKVNSLHTHTAVCVQLPLLTVTLPLVVTITPGPSCFSVMPNLSPMFQVKWRQKVRMMMTMMMTVKRAQWTRCAFYLSSWMMWCVYGSVCHQCHAFVCVCVCDFTGHGRQRGFCYRRNVQPSHLHSASEVQQLWGFQKYEKQCCSSKIFLLYSESQWKTRS